MTSMLFGGGILILVLAILCGLWVGVLGHRKAGRDGAWWTMNVALVFITIGILIPALAWWLIFEQLVGSSSGSGSPSLLTPFLGILTVLSYTLMPFGLILFSIGFALNGLKAGRIFERMKELEQVSDAMGEEISRLNSTEPRA